MTAETLLAQLADGTAPPVLDVRSGLEFRAGHLPGAIHVPFWLVPSADLPRSLDPDKPVVVYCGHGPRARMAGVALRARGFRQVHYLAGHMTGWRQRGLPEER